MEAREAIKHTPVHWTAPATENPPAQNVSGAKAEKPCLKPNRGLQLPKVKPLSACQPGHA